MSEQPLSQGQQIQQAIDTAITCRSIIKYSSNLSEQQKTEVLGEIESTLKFLETCVLEKTGNEARASFSPDKLLNEEDEEDLLLGVPQHPQSFSLPDLYRLHQLYLSEERVKHLETRYRTVMDVIDRVQELSSQRHDITSGDVTIDSMLHRIRGFITALYCMFREFALLLSNLVEGKSIVADTDALDLLGKYTFEVSHQQIVRDISPLMSVYTMHLQLQERRGTLKDCARDATAFFVFLEEALDPNFSRRGEIITQLNSISALLDEFGRLLTNYEQAVSSMLMV